MRRWACWDERVTGHCPFYTTGACLRKYPSCGEVNPSTKFFNVCCGGKVVIEHSEIDCIDEQKEEKKIVQQPKRLSTELQDSKKMLCFSCGKTFTAEKNINDHQTSCLNYVKSSNNPSKRYLTLQSFEFEARNSLKEDFYKDFFKL